MQSFAVRVIPLCGVQELQDGSFVCKFEGLSLPGVIFGVFFFILLLGRSKCTRTQYRYIGPKLHCMHRVDRGYVCAEMVSKSVADRIWRYTSIPQCRSEIAASHKFVV